MTSVQVGWNAALNHYNDVAMQTAQSDFVQRNDYYQMLQLYYDNLIFNQAVSLSQKYKAYQKYEHIRSLYNPTRRLVNFYANKVYPGVLSEDGSALPDGVSLAIPFARDTSPQIKEAIAQIWQWSNFQSKKSLLVRYGGLFGSVLAEVVDDLEHGKVSINIVKPGEVYAIDLDSAGNVKSYALQYKVRDEQQQLYTYKKEVDGKQIRHYRDDQLVQTVNHPYGFCPAVWAKIQDNGTDFGEPLIFETIGRLDELNGLVAHIIDQIHINAEAPVMLWGALAPNPNLFDREKRSQSQRQGDQEKMMLMYGPSGGRVDSLASGLDMAKADISVGHLMYEIEACHPELTLYKELRGMAQVTGPAAARLVDDVGGAVIESQALYDQQVIKLFQMCLTIGGMRANERAWGELNRQQAKFLAFTLDSYEAGDLDFAIMPRPILKPTKTEEAMQEQAVWTGVKLATEAGVPLQLILKKLGWTEEEIAELDAAEQARQAQIERDQMLAEEDEIPEVDQ